MPTYDLIPVTTQLGEIAARFEKKTLTAADALEKAKQVLTSASKLGIANTKARLAYVKEKHDEAKKVLEKMNQLLEELQSPDYIPEIYKLGEIQGGRDIINAYVKAVKDDGGTMYDKMGEYRANWGGTIAKFCPDDKFADKYIAIRTESMRIGKMAVAQAERLDEYAKRAELTLKAAIKARQGGERRTDELIADVEDGVKELETLESDAEAKIKPAAAKLKTLIGNKKLATYTGKEHKVSESFVEDIEVSRKFIAGKAKTALTLAKRLEPLYQPGLKELVPLKRRQDAALLNLQAHLKQVQECKADADKVYKELEKRKFSA